MLSGACARLKEGAVLVEQMLEACPLPSHLAPFRLQRDRTGSPPDANFQPLSRELTPQVCLDFFLPPSPLRVFRQTQTDESTLKWKEVKSFGRKVRTLLLDVAVILHSNVSGGQQVEGKETYLAL